MSIVDENGFMLVEVDGVPTKRRARRAQSSVIGSFAGASFWPWEPEVRSNERLTRLLDGRFLISTVSDY